MPGLVPRLLPRGWGDLLRQIVLVCGAYVAYRVVRGVEDGRAAVALAHARDVVGLEQRLGIFVEPAVQAWAAGQEWLMDAAIWLYLNAHFTLTPLALGFIYLARNEHFYFVRNMFVVSMALALVGYLLYPTAPPRLLGGWGFTDPVAAVTHGGKGAVGALYNPFAAMPSMHVGFALMLGLAMARIVRRRWAKALWCLYPALIAFVVLATANHWVLDAAGGALTAAVSAVCAQLLLARARPGTWAWTSDEGLGAPSTA